MRPKDSHWFRQRFRRLCRRFLLLEGLVILAGAGVAARAQDAPVPPASDFEFSISADGLSLSARNVEQARVLDELSDRLGIFSSSAQGSIRVASQPATVSALESRALEDSDPTERESALFALADFEDEAATEALLQALRDCEPRVREAAVAGLARLHSSSSKTSESLTIRCRAFAAKRWRWPVVACATD